MDRRALGAGGEAAAARALERHGYRVIARNVRSRAGEIDLVCRDGDAYVFCEVKARRPSAFGDAREALPASKRERLARLAAGYLAHVGDPSAEHRIELVAVDLRADGTPDRVRLLPLV